MSKCAAILVLHHNEMTMSFHLDCQMLPCKLPRLISVNTFLGFNRTKIHLETFSPWILFLKKMSHDTEIKKIPVWQRLLNLKNWMSTDNVFTNADHKALMVVFVFKASCPLTVWSVTGWIYEWSFNCAQVLFGTNVYCFLKDVLKASEWNVHKSFEPT